MIATGYAVGYVDHYHDPYHDGYSDPYHDGYTGDRVPVGAGLSPFTLVRTLAGQGKAQKPRVTLPRYATLESARSIHCPSMGLLRRPTPGDIVEGGRFSRPCGSGALRAHLRKAACGFATTSLIIPLVIQTIRWVPS